MKNAHGMLLCMTQEIFHSCLKGKETHVKQIYYLISNNLNKHYLIVSMYRPSSSASRALQTIGLRWNKP